MTEATIMIHKFKGRCLADKLLPYALHNVFHKWKIFPGAALLTSIYDALSVVKHNFNLIS